jgi:hypothetical protein
VEEARELFWGTFAAGKGFAKRASYWDLLFMGIGSMGRDEGLLAFVLRFVMHVSGDGRARELTSTIEGNDPHVTSDCLRHILHQLSRETTRS